MSKRLTRQVLALVGITLRGMRYRVGAAIVLVVSMACLVAVFLSVVAISDGIEKTMTADARADRVTITQKGSIGAIASAISREVASSVQTLPGVKREGNRVLASAEFVGMLPIKKVADNLDAFVPLLGFGSEGLSIRPEIQLIEGRQFSAGGRELIVGRRLLSEFQGVKLGGTLPLPEGGWTIVGVFSSPGGSYDSSVIGDAETLLASLRRTSFSNVTLLLESPDQFDVFTAALRIRPALQVEAELEATYAERQSRPLTLFYSRLALTISLVMGVGAMMGAVNTLSTIMDARRREIATMQAIGFGRLPIAISVFLESVILAVLGGLLGSIIVSVALSNTQSISNGLVFDLHVSGAAVSWSLIIVSAIALIGSIPTAIRVARSSIVVGLRAA